MCPSPARSHKPKPTSSKSPRPKSEAHARRLEALWGGRFGNAYTQRNAAASEGRQPFWSKMLRAHPCERILEVGCNLGGNLRWIATLMPPSGVYGLEINESALKALRGAVPAVNPVWGTARELPFRDRWFDMVFTMGVLIHQPPATLPLVMAEIVRCSRRWVLAGEYYADEVTEVPYRGHAGALYKRDFGGLYQELFPELKLREKGFLPRGSGWDDVTYWLFEKQ